MVRSALKIIIAAALLLSSAQTQSLSADEIVSSAVEAYGGEAYKTVDVDFVFRGVEFGITHDNGLFEYTRTTRYDKEESEQQRYLIETINNKGYFIEVDGELREANAEERAKIDGRLNSVVYFALLPYRLLDDAAQRVSLGKTAIKGTTYHTVEVTFEAEGGGRDYEDRYIYWFDVNDFSMDYFAYYYHVNEGGSRFRVVHNPREVDGVIFTDHDNYTAEGTGADIERYPELYEADRLKKVSEVNLESIEPGSLE